MPRPLAAEFLALWEEHEAGATLEAKLVSDTLRELYERVRDEAIEAGLLSASRPAPG
ncbi:hypothetical protein [Herbihabitans rhizosphaerae]|uniref:hypothetical protein n=1 Tax=Herbihabitans rhizosphaerae TaxID=1872711 RepID=UPI003BF8C3FF